MRLIETTGQKFIFKWSDPSREEWARIKDRVKAIPAAKFTPVKPSGGYWEVPVSASSALECADVAQNYAFVMHDDARRLIESVASKSIDMISLSLGQKIITDNFGMKRELYQYQKQAVQYGLLAGSHLNGDGRGCGKTPIAIALVDSQELYPVLVITIKRGKINWYREWQDWTAMRSVSVWTNETRGHTKVDIIDYYMVPKLVEYILNYRQYKCVILDESHYCKDNSTARTKAVMRIIEKIPTVYLLTGTAIVNSMRDLYNQLVLIDRNTLFGNQFNFLQQYTNAEKKTIYLKGQGGKTKEVWEYSGKKNEKQLYTTLRANCFIGRKLREVNDQMPPLTEIYIDTPADSEEYKLQYQATTEVMIKAQDQLSRVRRPGSMEEGIILKEADKNIFQLRRESGLAKLSNIKEWLFEFIETEDEKIIMFAHHAEVQQTIAAWMPDITVSLKAGQSEVEAQAAIDRFQKEERCKIIVCSQKAASENITLTAASYMAIAEPPLTDKDEDQMTGRMDRVGQQRGMVLYKLYDMRPTSIDSMIVELLKVKKELGQINSTKYFIEKFTNQ